MSASRRPDTGLRNLWIDGNVYPVPVQVYAEFKFLHALNSSLVRILNRLSPDAVAERRKAEAEAERVRS